MGRLAASGLALAGLAILAPPGPPPARAEEKKREEFPLLVAGRKALAEGKAAEARAIFLEARAQRPEDPEVIGELLRVDGKDPEARFLWAMEAVAAAGDPAGRAFLPKGFPPLAPEEGTAVRGILLARVAALQELRKAGKASEGPTMGALQAWLRSVADRLAAGSPALRKEFLVPLGESGGRSWPDREAVFAALRACIEKGKAPGKAPLGLEAARVLRGLRFQISQRDSAGGSAAKPGGDDDLAELDAEIQSFRETIAAGLPKPFTADEILAVPPVGGPEFQALHGTLANPGMALSPTGLYRIETTGGLQTLQAVVRNVERCHARLVKWFGKDPFGGAQGRIRLRPEYGDLESDGARHWWADGWQSGRLTTIHTCFEDALTLSATLTHELTHRFDAAANPGIPAWLAEGRAVHAEIATASLMAGALDESQYSTERLLTACNAGIGDVEDFGRLVAGTGDYRDNYTAGYALWIFLTTFRGFEEPTPEPLYASRIPVYLAACAAGGKPEGGEVARFKAAFTDGQEGRPTTLKAFARQLAVFLHGVAASTPETVPPWVRPWEMRMAGRSPTAPPLPLVGDGDPAEGRAELYDRSNWPKTRVRSAPAEPGTEQARRAAAVFREAGLARERVLALEWAVSRDDPTRDLCEEAAEAHAAVGEAGPAWALRRTAASLFPGGAAPAADGPPKEAAAVVKAVAAVAAALDAETDRALGRGHGRLALALRAERDDLAVLSGLPAKGLPAGASPGAAPVAGDLADTAPFCSPWTSLASLDLTGRIWAPLGPKVSPRFHLAGENTLVLGSARDATGDTATLWYQSVFVENPARLEGTWSVDTSWRSESPYFEALLVVGKEGDDRGFTITISGGDAEAAIRRLRSGRGISTLRLSLSDSRPLEDRLTPQWRDVALGGTSPIVRLRVDVSGPSILVSVNGETVLRHRRLTGAAIRGTVGFGVRHGTVAVVNPRFRRHRAAGDGRQCACGEWDAPVPWDSARPFPFRLLEGRRLEPAAGSPGGGLLFWYTEANLPSQMDARTVREFVAASREPLRPWSHGFETLVSFPAAGRLLCDVDWTPPEARAVGQAPGTAGVHAFQPEFAGRIWKDAAGARAGEFLKDDLAPEKRERLEKEVGREIGSPWCLWIDPDGIVRRAYSGATGHRVPGIDEKLFRYFSGW